MQGQVCPLAGPPALPTAACVSLQGPGGQARRGLGKGGGARWMLFPAYRPPWLCKRVRLARSHTSPQDLEPCTPLLRAGVLPGSLRAARHRSIPGTGLGSAPTAPSLPRGGGAGRQLPQRGWATPSWPAPRCPFPAPGARCGCREPLKQSRLLRFGAACSFSDRQHRALCSLNEDSYLTLPGGL